MYKDNRLQGWYYGKYRPRGFKCLGWLCPATFFCFSRHQSATLWSSRALKPGPETRDVGTRVSGRKWVHSTELDIVNGSFCNLCALALAGVTYTVLTSSNKSETAVHCCDPALSVLVVLVSRNIFHVVSALQSIVFIQRLVSPPHSNKVFSPPLSRTWFLKPIFVSPGGSEN